jgi:hypothetical protein
VESKKVELRSRVEWWFQGLGATVEIGEMFEVLGTKPQVDKEE